MNNNQPLFILVTGLIILSLLAIFFSSDQVFKFPDWQILQETSQVSGDIKSGIVARVVDGDTIELENKITIRYLNIDTPETKKPNTPVMCYGPEASKANKELVEKKTVWLRSDKEDQDRYKRKLRFIFLNEQDTNDVNKSVNATLVRSGLARVSIYKPNNTFEKDFYKLETEAKETKRGIWSACKQPFVN
jgi:micrococcal nuclease